MDSFVRKVCFLIDYYPDYSFYFILLVSFVSQIIIGNSYRVLVFSLFLMLFVLLIDLPFNILIKNLLMTRRPKNYYLYHGFKKSLFEGSFPSFHAQFSSSEAVLFITVVYLLSSIDMRFLATITALFVTGGLAFVVAWSRVRLGVHYLVDIVGGIVFGVPIGYIVAVSLTSILVNTSIVHQVVGGLVFLLLVHVFASRERRHVQ